MKRMNQLLALTGACALLLGANQLSAQDNNTGDRPQRRQGGEGGDRQGRGGFGGDPAEFQQRMLDGVKDRLEVKDETEWKAIEPLVKKVMDARREAMVNQFRGAFGSRGGGRGGDQGGGGGGGGRGGMFGGEPMPEQEALQKAIDSKAPSAELKTAVAKYREAKKAKEAALQKAQDELRKVLSVRQEAIAVNSGLLN